MSDILIQGARTPKGNQILIFEEPDNNLRLVTLFYEDGSFVGSKDIKFSVGALKVLASLIQEVLEIIEKETGNGQD